MKLYLSAPPYHHLGGYSGGHVDRIILVGGSWMWFCVFLLFTYLICHHLTCRLPFASVKVLG